MKSRSLLPSDDPMYISPGAIERIKSKASRAAGSRIRRVFDHRWRGIENTSRTAYERGKITTPADARADSKDLAWSIALRCGCVWCRRSTRSTSGRTGAVPGHLRNDREVLAVNESPNTHDHSHTV